MKLKNVSDAITIDISSQAMWDILTQYGDVSNFHAGVIQSSRINNSQNTATIGCERVCNIVDMGLKIMLKERIVDYIEGVGYQYEVYEWKNFPLKKMFFGFKISLGEYGETILRIDIDYKASPAFLTPLMAGKMRRLIKDVLLGYKHYAETGERRTPIKSIRKLYKNEKFKISQVA